MIEIIILIRILCVSVCELLQGQNTFLESILKAKQFNTAFHWPKAILPCIQNIRNQVSNYSKDGENFTGCQILIRPNPNSGKSLYISYRATSTGNKWVSLDQVKTPALPSLLEKFKEPQPSKSKYFQL